MALRVEQPNGPGPSDASFQEMAGAGHGQATQAPRGVVIPHDPAHYGRASAEQAEESEVMNAAGGATPSSPTSRKAKRKTAPVERDGQSRKE